MANFLIAAGGTGGHVLPGLEVAKELRRRGHRSTIVGTRRGLKNRLAPAAGFQLETLRIGPLNNVSPLRRLRTAVEAPASLVAAWRLLGRQRPAAVLSLGGYAAGPLAAAAVLRRTPLAILEPNAYPGLANRLTGRFARLALLGFPEAATFFPPGRSETIGVPIRKEFFELPPKRPEPPWTVLVTGGSQGSRTLNRAAAEAARRWSAKPPAGGLKMLHQTGEADYNGLQSQYARETRAPEIVLEATPFIDDMPAAFAAAHLIVCRSGASALAELAAAGKPAVLIPFPHAADQHQLRNAEAWAASGAAQLALDADWSGERMAADVEELLQSPEKLESMATAARRRARPGAAERASDHLEAFARSA